MSKLTSDNLDKYLCFWLRHEPEKIELNFSSDGWVNILEIIKNIDNFENFKVNIAELEDIVKKDDKGRFQISSDGKFIRCVQGHSTPLFKGIDNAVIKNIEELPDFLYHGTKKGATSIILKDGLSKMKRTHVHLIEDEKIAIENGMRWKDPTCSIIVIDIKKMFLDGIKIEKTINNVYLVENVDPKYFQRIYDLKNIKLNKKSNNIKNN